MKTTKRKDIFEPAQPSIKELQSALEHAKNCDNIPGKREEALKSLERIRDARTTWFGRREDRFRFQIDDYLMERGYF